MKWKIKVLFWCTTDDLLGKKEHSVVRMLPSCGHGFFFSKLHVKLKNKCHPDFSLFSENINEIYCNEKPSVLLIQFLL